MSLISGCGLPCNSLQFVDYYPVTDVAGMLMTLNLWADFILCSFEIVCNVSAAAPEGSSETEDANQKMGRE